jgi:peptidoglycan/LPS O-acetylase OafA/YrhL
LDVEAFAGRAAETSPPWAALRSQVDSSLDGARNGQDHVRDSRSRGKNERFVFIDGLRGLAALAVLTLHTYTSPTLHSLSASMPAPVDYLVRHGWLAVQVFFVVSGFVIAYSLRNARVSPRVLGNFALRRTLRLDPPYWATLAVAVLALSTSNLLLKDRVAPIPGRSAILAHAFYLQDLLGLSNFLPVSWTLCLEMQMYLAYIVTLGFSQWLARRKGYWCRSDSVALLLVFMPLAVLSIVVAKFVGCPVQGTLVPFWYQFFFGALIWWTLEGKVSRSWFWLYVAMTVGIITMSQLRSDTLVVLATGCIIYLAAARNRLHVWLKAVWIQYLGRISYGLYLTHGLVGIPAVNLAFRLLPDADRLVLLWAVLVMATSIGSAHLLHVLIERPCAGLAKRLKTKAVPAAPARDSLQPRAVPDAV